MLLACDIGNTFIKFAVYDNDSLISFTKSHHDNLALSSFAEYNITNAAISSVVPQTEQMLITLISEYLGAASYPVKINSPFQVKLNYLTPETLGIDRMCSAEGAFSIFRNDPLYNDYNKDVIVLSVDSGTATTINIVKYNAEFIGGLIAPGINTMVNSLNKGTAQLPKINVDNDYQGLIGTDTNTCIASGILNSTLGLIERTYNYLTDRFNAKVIKIYVTGGNGKMVSENLKYENIFVEDLVLRGVKSVFERANGD